jgi:choline monooxygenase
MYRTKHSLQPLLSPDRYFSPEAHHEDAVRLRGSAWHLVGTKCSLASPGDYIATTILGTPILVRNCDGNLHGFRNVCAHRHCELFDEGIGHSEQFKCRYHGWQYGADGLTRRLPKSNLFPKFERESHCLETFEVECCGQLVFVKLSAKMPSLREWFGDYYEEFAKGSCPGRWTGNLIRCWSHEANWKILIEGSLESYHIDEVHPKTFGQDPGEELSEHEFRETGSSISIRAAASHFYERLERWSLNWLTNGYVGGYRHVHIYPNLMASFVDSASVFYQIEPITPERSEMRVFGFGPVPGRDDWGRRFYAWGLRKFVARVVRKVLDEDAAIFPKVQRGKRNAIDRGIYARSEERLESFQRHLMSIPLDVD